MKQSNGCMNVYIVFQNHWFQMCGTTFAIFISDTFVDSKSHYCLCMYKVFWILENGVCIFFTFFTMVLGHPILDQIWLSLKVSIFFLIPWRTLSKAVNFSTLVSFEVFSILDWMWMLSCNQLFQINLQGQECLHITSSGVQEVQRKLKVCPGKHVILMCTSTLVVFCLNFVFPCISKFILVADLNNCCCNPNIVFLKFVVFTWIYEKMDPFSKNNSS